MHFVFLAIFAFGIGNAKFVYEKTRYDRSVNKQLQDIVHKHYKNDKKQRILTDFNTHFTAYKDAFQNICYLEKGNANSLDTNRRNKFQFFIADKPLKKIEAYRLAGNRIVEFCKGMKIYLLENTEPVPEFNYNPQINKILKDRNENDDKPFDTRRRIIFQRYRRDATPYRGRFRGQTQSQYLNIGSGDSKDGKAEAEATLQSSRAVVSGSSGMGQAQSMSAGSDGCEGCNGSVQQGVAGTSNANGTPTGVYPSNRAPGKIIYPSSNGPITASAGGPNKSTDDNTLAHVPIDVYRHQNAGGTSQGTDNPISFVPNNQMNTGSQILIGKAQGVLHTAGQGASTTNHGNVYDIRQPGATSQHFPNPQLVGPSTNVPQILPSGAIPNSGPNQLYDQKYVYPGRLVNVPTDIRYKPAGSQEQNSDSTGAINPHNIVFGEPRPGTQISGPTARPGINDGMQKFEPTILQQQIPTHSTQSQGTQSSNQGTYAIVPVSQMPANTNIGGHMPGVYGVIQSPTNELKPTHLAENTPTTYSGGMIPNAGNNGIPLYERTHQNDYKQVQKNTGTIISGQTTNVLGAAQTNGLISNTGNTGQPLYSMQQPNGNKQIPYNVGNTGTIRYDQGSTGQGVTQTNSGYYAVAVPGASAGTGTPVNYPVVAVVSPGTVTNQGALVSTIRGDIPGAVIYPGSTDGTNAGVLPLVNYPVAGLNGGRQSTDGLTNERDSSNIDNRNWNVGSGVLPSYNNLDTVSKQTAGSADNLGTSQADLNLGGASVSEDGSDSQAMSSVKQGEDGTLASASAEGKYGQGSAKSQVSGIYTGTGSFSAQAGTSDNMKSSLTQVSGGKEGASSSALSSGGLGKSQTQVQLNSQTGSVSTGAQSSGQNHGTNTQVQASSKGGMADAQANGEGQTSSQAQIGFQPYANKNEQFKKLDNPFKGGGTASAQSGTTRGQSQTQLEGSFHYGITYTGAAQAGSGSGSGASRKPINFTDGNHGIFKTFNLEGKLETKSETPKEQLETSSSSRKTFRTETPRSKSIIPEKIRQSSVNGKSDKNSSKNSGAEEYDEYEDEDDKTYGQKQIFQSNVPKSTKQMLSVITDGDFDVRVKQEESKIAKNEDPPHWMQPEYAVSPFTAGKVVSLAGKKTIAQGDGKAFSQTVILIPSNNSTSQSDSKALSTDTRSLKSEHDKNNKYQSNENSRDEESASPRTNYVTVSNSVAGKIDENNTSKTYEHRYYTKSSTCGYFTFSCNIVYGSNGKRKVCKPKLPTSSDGTPKCKR